MASNQPHLNYIPAEVYVTPPSTETYISVQQTAENEGYWKRIQRNKPQSNSATAVSLIFISGGMNLGWYFTINGKHELLSWFIGGIIGAVIGAIACNYISKKFITRISSTLVLICGIIQATGFQTVDSILAYRYLNGIAVGFIFPMAFVLIGEEFVKSLRGMNAAAVEVVGFTTGIFVHTVIVIVWTVGVLENHNFRMMQVLGVLHIIWGLLAFIVGSFLTIESPIYYLTRGDETSALDSLKHLQRPNEITAETYQQLEEHKLYVAENKQRTLDENAYYGVPALLKLCFYRTFIVLGFSSFINNTFYLSLPLSSDYELLYIILYTFARFLGPLIVIYTLDYMGRKPSMIVGFVVSTVLAFTVGGIFDNISKFSDAYSLNAVKYILIVFQLFNSMSVSSSSAYLSEAFPLAVKSYYIAIVYIVEMLVHIIIIESYYSIQEYKNSLDFSKYFLTLGSLSLVFLAVAVLVMPETKCNSLRECLPKMKQLNNFRK